MTTLKHSGFFEDWIDGCSVFSAPLGSPHDTGFPRTFYQSCVRVFVGLKSIPSGPIYQSCVLKTALSKLVLWTDGIPDRELDAALGGSPQLRSAILELLNSLALNLFKGMCIRI